LLLRNKSFLILMAGELIGGIGLWFSIIANLQFMSGLLSSDFLKSLVLMIGMFASVLCLPQIGKIVDRYDRRAVLMAANALRCLSPVLMMPALIFDSIPWMIASLIVLQVSGAVYFPAVRTTLPALVKREDLLAANTFHMNAITISRIAGTAIAGVLVSLLSLYTIYISAFVVYAALIVMFLFIQVPARETKATVSSKDKLKFTEVFAIIRKERAVTIGIVATGVVNFFLGGINLFVLSVSQIQDNPKMMGFMYAAEGVSILIAGLFVRKIIGSANLVKLAVIQLFIFAVAEMIMSFVHTPVTVLAGFGLFGIMIAFFFPMLTTVFQQRVPAEMHGRFFSFKEIIDRILIQVALLATGACFDLFGTSVYVAGIAVLTALVGTFALMMTLRHKLNVRQYI